MPRKIALPLLLVLIASVYLFTARDRALLDDGDALYAHVAQQMVEHKEWVTPYANGVRFLDKPPLMYWAMATAFEVFGITEFAARLPSVLAVLGTAWLLFHAGKRTGGHSSGFTAGAAAAFCVGTFLFTRMVFPDILFVFLLTLGLCSFLEWYSDPDNPIRPAMLFYASVAGALLTKGLIGVVFPVAIIFLFFLWSRDWSRLKNFHFGKGTTLLLVLALPWHLVAAKKNPGFLWYYFVNEQFLRFLGRRQPVDYESISLPIFWILILVWLFPWSAFLPAIRHLLHDARYKASHSRAVVGLSLCWVIVVLGFFSLSSRIEHYALPLIPPLALLVGIALTPENLYELNLDDRRQRWIGRGFSFLGVLGGLIGLCVSAGAIFWMRGWRPLQSLHQAGAQNLRAYPNFFAPLFDLSPETLAGLQAPLIGTAITMSLGLLGAWWCNRRGKRIAAILTLCIMMVGFCLFTFQSLEICEDKLSSRQFGRVLAKLYLPGDCAITVGDFETANSVIFYSPINLEVYAGSAALLEWGLRYPDAPAVILSKQDLEARWRGPQRTFLIVPDSMIARLPIEKRYWIYRSAGRSLLCNRPISIDLTQFQNSSPSDRSSN